MTGLEALNKFVNIFAEYCVKAQYQEMNATNMQTAVEYLARSKECRTIEKSLKALEIIKKNFEFGLFETDKYKVYIYSSDDDYSVVKRISQEEFELLRSVLE